MPITRLILAVSCFFFDAIGYCASELSYRFNFYHHKLFIDLSFQGNKKGETILILPSEWAGHQHLDANIKNLKVLNNNISIIHNPKSEQITLKHAPLQNIHVRYELSPKQAKKLTHPDDLLLPQVTPHYFYFVGWNGLVVPENNSQEKIKFKLEWILPKNWQIANSFGSHQLTQLTFSALEDFNNSFFIAGNFQVKRVHEKNTDIDTVVLGKFSQLNIQEYAKDCVKIIDYFKSFWHDDVRYKLIVYISLATHEDQTGGTRLNDAFVLGLAQNATLKSGYGLNYLAAHEIFHAWNNPNNYTPTHQHHESELYWITEGFTDYYAFESLYRMGLISFSDYLDSYNEILRDYYTSMVNHETNQAIEKNFWHDYFLEKLPYQRGNILAHQWNVEILKASNGRYSFDNLMRDIQGKHFNLEQINEISKKYLKWGIAPDVQKYIISGELIKPFPDTFGKKAQMVYKKMVVKKDVFPVIYNPQTFRIEKISKGSEAEAAGLKVGDILLDYDFSKYDPSYPVKLLILRQDQKIKISYKIPNYQYIDVPQFVIF